ncbi:MAG: hypothetical protein ACREXK_09415 [Gammaproteobacteria bacterium]
MGVAVSHVPQILPASARKHEGRDELRSSFHADHSAAILSLLEPVRAGNGLDLELGCGSGLLTRRLLDAGHRAITTKRSRATLDLAGKHDGNPA